MKLERHVYTTRGQKVGDLIIGVVIWHVFNIGYWVLFSLLFALLGMTPTNTFDTSSFTGILSLICSCLPLIINIGLLIYFGLTRYWIALGMLGTFAAYIFIIICVSVLFGVACFAILSSATNSGF